MLAACAQEKAMKALIDWLEITDILVTLLLLFGKKFPDISI